jgi:hypothetical protein
VSKRLGSLLSGLRIGRQSATDAPQPLTFSIGALPAARSTGPSTTRNVGFSVGNTCLEWGPSWPLPAALVRRGIGSLLVVRDHNGQALSYVYFEDEPGQRSKSPRRSGA